MNSLTIKRRSDCFFGIHSDFHAKPAEGLVIGETLKERDAREICELLKPDFIQVDCKGHPGWASYPTGLSNAMPAFKADPLRLWRNVTREYGIGLYVHFSGVYEIKYCLEHPEEAVMDPDGNYTSSVLPFSRYYDDYFIPQISELVEKYQIDGVWIDGDCWSVNPDYRQETLQKFEKETGIELNGKAPKTREDPFFAEYIEFAREQYRKTLRYYTDVLHKKYPHLQICSNWAFSDHMPEKICADVDFLSGDLNPANCVNSARYAGRMLAQQNKTWDLMSWNFRLSVYNTSLIPPKHPAQLMQEAASVISLGGAFQDNISQFSDASHNLLQLRKIAPLASFLRQRQPYCFKGRQIHQAAMLVPTYDRYREMTKPFSREGMEKFMGLTALLCDSGQSLELVGEYTLKDNYAEYPLIVVPELSCGIDDDTVRELKEYASNGGSLLLVGAKTSRIFADKGFDFVAEYYNEVPEIPNWANCDIGHNVEKYATTMPCYFSLNGEEHGITAGACRVTACAGNQKVFGMLHYSLRSEGVPFAVQFGFGKGSIAVIGADLGSQYLAGMQHLHRKLIQNITAELYSPLARIESACGLLEMVCLEKENHLMLQLINANGNHANPNSVTEDMIPPVVDVKLPVKAESPPVKLLLQPENKPIEFVYQNQRIYFQLDRIDIHNIVEMCS